MQPVKRPLADWVDERLIPFAEDHPYLTRLLPLYAGLAYYWIKLWLEGQDDTLPLKTLMWIGIFTVAWYVSDWEQMLIAWRRRRLEALRDSRVCLHCGYDLRATPKRCPECGRRTDEPIEV
jgi:hypothetical protein